MNIKVTDFTVSEKSINTYTSKLDFSRFIFMRQYLSFTLQNLLSPSCPIASQNPAYPSESVSLLATPEYMLRQHSSSPQSAGLLQGTLHSSEL